MDIDLYRIESTGLAGLARITGLSGDFSDPPDRPARKIIKSGFIWSSAVLVAGLGAWTLLSGDHGDGVAHTPPVSFVTPAASEPAPEPAQPLPAPVDGLKISSQSWRRGGLGSKALVTFTLRNRNDYAVKDIEISCAFTRRDGSHLTDRTRTIPATVGMKSRKTIARMHVGYVNVNADKAKCALVAASRL